MDHENASWNFGILYASLSVLFGMIGLVSTHRTEEESLAKGQFWQGILLMFTVTGTYFHRSSSLYLGSLVVVGLLIVQTLLGARPVEGENAFGEEDTP